MKPLKLSILTSAVLFSLANIAQADCPVDGATPMKIGPHNPQTTFPLWVQDTEGLALEICPGTDPLNCISVPPFTVADFPGDPDAAAKAALSQQIGSGDEGFWASAETFIDLPSGGLALLVSAVEAAFLPDFADGNQFAFTRLRLRVDIPNDGTYIVTHPWGQITYPNLVVDPNKPGREINDSFDLPFVADEDSYQGRIGPVLTWDTFPEDPLLDRYGPPYQFNPPFGTGAPDGIPDYIGTINYTNPLTGDNRHAVTGSPCGTNVFRIEGPNIGGPGIDLIETDLFIVTGKVYNGVKLPTPLAVNQVTYSRDLVGRVNVFANAPSGALVSFSGDANLPAGPVPMTGDGSRRFYGAATLTPDMTTVPASVDVTAEFLGIAPALSPNTQTVPLVDLITVTRADYDHATGNLTIEAHSSDQFEPPTLTTLGQNLTGGVLTTILAVAPPTVTVTSSAGGTATAPVTIIHSVQ